MTPNEQIDNFAKGWIANRVRYEPIAKLLRRWRFSVFMTLLFSVVFILSLLTSFGSMTRFGFIRMDVTLAILALTMGACAVQLSRFINLRKELAGQVEL